MALRTVGVRLAAEVSGYINNLRTAKAATKDFVSELDRSAKAGKLNAVADRAAHMGLVLVGAFAAVETAAARFEKKMSAVDAATHASSDQLARLSTAAIQAGKDTKYSATQAAGGIEELGKAGISVSNILGGGLTGTLSLAAAGEIEVAEAAETAASALTMFKLKGSDVSHVADLLAAASGKAQGGVRDMSMALDQSGLVASQMGLSIEETIGTLAAFAKAGFLGSDAGTSLKTALLRIAAPSDIAKTEMDRLGISAFDAQGKFVGMAKFAGNLQNALKGMSQEQRMASLNIIFGTDAIRAASIIYDRGEQGVQDWITAVDDSGFAADTARRKTNNLMGDIERLTGSLESMAIESGSGGNKGLRVLVQTLQALVDQFGRLPSGVSGTVVVLAGVAGAALLAGSAFIKVRKTTADVSKELVAMGPAGAKAAAGLQAVTKWGGRAAGVFAALQVVGAVGQAMSSASADADRLARSMKDLGASQQASGELARVFGQDLDRLRTNLSFMREGMGNAEAVADLEALSGVLAALPFSMSRRVEEMKALDSALAQLASGGNAKEAAAWFSRIADEAAKQGISIEQLKAILPAYTQAAADASAAQSGLAASQEQATANAAILEQGLAGLVHQTGSLTKAWERLHGSQVSWAEAQIDVEAAIDALTESLQKNGHALDFDSEKGRENQRAILDVVKSAKDAAQAKYDGTVATQGEAGALRDANQIYNDYIGRLRAALEKQHLTKKQIDDLIAAYASMPSLIATRVTTPGLDSALAKLRELERMARDRRMEIRTGISNRAGGVYEHAATGVLRDPQVFSSVNTGARYAFAEPGTGGEAFIPRYGDWQRAMSILDHAAGWYGARVMPNTSAGPSAPAGPSAADFGRAVKAALHGVAVVMDGHVVGRIDAKRADLLGRGG